jgi:hypothetical protein
MLPRVTTVVAYAARATVALPPYRWEMRHSGAMRSDAITSDVASPVPPTEVTPADPAPPPVDLTGVPAVDAALRRLETLDEVPLTEHAAVYEQVHADLRCALDGPSGHQLSLPSAPLPTTSVRG